MSQGQPRKPQAGGQQDEPIKYGDVFPVSGDLAKQPVAPKDAAVMQSAETTMQGQTQKHGPAAASTVNDIPPYFDLLLREDGVAAKFPADKAVTREDAEEIMSAELRNDPEMKMHPGGVAESVTAAATKNEQCSALK